jgi:hypothetical protein
MLLPRQRHFSRAIPVLAVWLLFFPNAPYVLTDLIHLRQRVGVPLWYDLVMILAFAFTSLWIGFHSLRLVQRWIASHCGPRLGWAMVLAVTSRPEGSRAGSASAVPDVVREEARAASRWFQERVRAWRAEDVARWNDTYIGLDDMGLVLPDREKVLARHFGTNLLGHGVFRAVVASSDPRFVVKLAMRPSDNLDEAAFWEEAGPKTRALLVPVVGVDPDGHWLIMERVTPLPWEPEDGPTMKAMHQRGKAVGLFDVHADNVSTDLRILDYAEPVSSRGTPNTRTP